jgi:hypothetical protein
MPERGETTDKLEIIRPDRAGGAPGVGRSRIRVSINARAVRSYQTLAPGLVAIVLAMLVVGILFLAILMILVGVFLVWILVASAVAAVLLVFAFRRGNFRQRRND